jgi:CDP-diacylglycerol--serine O-phosphatidyltransferase
MRITRLISIADIFTLVNALLGFTSIVLALEGEMVFAIYAILVGILCDGLDGMVARRFSRKWYLGDYLDVMADTTSFCVAPSVVIFVLVRGWADIQAGALGVGLLYAACGSSVVCGLLRLARFCHLAGGHSTTFIGLPSPASALVLSLLALQPYTSAATLPPWLMPAAAVVLAGLMVSDLRYPKVRGAYAIVSGVAIFLVMLAERFEFTKMVAEFLLDMALLLALAYVAAGPFTPRLGGRRAAHGQG